MVGGNPAKTHDECLTLVCAVCTNLNGKKPQRGITYEEVILVQKHVFVGYQQESTLFPTGICTRCALDLYYLEKQSGQGDEGALKKKKIKLKLPDDYLCEIPKQTRSKASSVCDCRWCKLARLNGPEFRRWQQGLRKKVSQDVTYICGSCGRGVLATASSHKCNVSEQARVQALMMSLPDEVKGKLTVALLREQQDGEGSSTISLPQPQGGKLLEVTVGRLPDSPEVKQLSLIEVQVIAGKAHLTGEQQESVVADLRCKFGRKVVESGLQKAIPAHNRKYSEFFTVEEKEFRDKDNNILKKNLYFCHSPKELPWWTG